MKQLTLVLLYFCLFAGYRSAIAQDLFLNIEAGPNSSQFYGSGNQINKSAIYNYYLGSTIDITFSNLTIAPGVFFSTQGGSSSVTTITNGSTNIATSTLTLRYLNFPVDVIYKIKAGSGKILIGAGPYFGYGLEGKNKTTNTVNGQQNGASDYDVYFGILDGQVRNHDFGFNFLTGYDFNRFAIKGGYMLGLRNLSNYNVTPYSKNKVFTLGFSYKLAKFVNP